MAVRTRRAAATSEPVHDLPHIANGGFGWRGRARAVLRLAGFLGWTLSMIPVQMVLLRLPGSAKARFPQMFHRVLCRILGVQVVVHGVPAPVHPVLFIANHSSWLDIPVLSTAAPLSFVAKSEVRAWPLFGLMSQLQRTVYVERARRTHAARHRDALAERLRAGDALVLFAEGTSSDGNRVLGFKTALFSAAETPVPVAGAETAGAETGVLVQPVAIAYTRLNGMPMGRDLRPFFAWYGDMELGPHLWQALQMGPLTSEIVFLEPVRLADLGSRKALARHCQAQVAGALGAALRGAATGWPGAVALADPAPAPSHTDPAGL